MTYQWTDEQRKSGFAIVEANPKLKEKASKVLQSMYERGEIDRQVPANSIIALINDSESNNLIACTFFNEYPIPLVKWASIPLD